MKYNFDEVINRKNTNCIKYDSIKTSGKPENIIPLWVADMDFKSPPAVSEALIKISQHGIFGYSHIDDTYFKAVFQWYHTRFGWDIQREWLINTPGVVHALATAVRAFTKKGESVLIQTPVYPPFYTSITENHRILVTNQLIYQNGTYQIDFDDFEQQIKQHQVKLFILCSPHNPIGRVWTKQELTKMIEICQKYHVLIISDEIHSDFVYQKGTHHILASLNPIIEQNCIICTAPSKTFNLAGLQISNILIPNPKIREKFSAVLSANHTGDPNLFGLTACQAAYEHGAEWLDQLLIYLSENICYVRDFLKKQIPQIQFIQPQGTYLLWLDCTALPIAPEQLEDFFIHQAGLWLNDGTMFGENAKGFQRVNIACPRSILEQAMHQLKLAVDRLY